MAAAIRNAAFALMALGSLGVAGYAVVAYSLVPLGDLVHPDMKNAFNASKLTIYAHIFGAAFALLLGPWQFVRALRSRYPKLHRVSGRLYLMVGVGIGGVAGFFAGLNAFGGWTSQIGFALLAITWLFTGVMAFVHIRAGDVAAHRRWMIRNFALALSAVTLRIQLGLLTLAGVPFESFYPWLAWTCWLPNLVVAEWLIRVTARVTYK
ncbi:MAG: DUF2306 domain-containing protein [Phycisphaerales bacterium]|jgi:uncharacterized membrane protein